MSNTMQRPGLKSGSFSAHVVMTVNLKDFM